MTLAALWAWIIANEAAVATILLIVSELLGATPAVKANGILSFLLLKGQELLKARGGKDPTPEE